MASVDHFPDLARKRLFVAVKAADHGVEKGVFVEPVQVKGMSGTRAKHRKKGVLRPAVPLAKGVNGVELREKMSTRDRKLVRFKIADSAPAEASRTIRSLRLGYSPESRMRFRPSIFVWFDIGPPSQIRPEKGGHERRGNGSGKAVRPEAAPRPAAQT
ncbi:hypothetical protein L5876_00615 [Hyphobacterium sp. SN044]|nr:hypothetical protein [Hyphobacterium sp. SN044]MCF8878315.1 hypothetical protein [Hyphobacterium sp. SN044]